MDAYVRVAALLAAIVHIVPRRDTEGTKIDWFSGPAQKKFGRHSPRSGIGSEEREAVESAL